MYLEISAKIDHFYFKKLKQNKSGEIFFTGTLLVNDILNYFKSSLKQNKIVIVSCEQDLPEINISSLNFKNHHLFYSDTILILNYPLKNIINKNLDENSTIQNYQELDSYLRVHLSNIFR